MTCCHPDEAWLVNPWVITINQQIVIPVFDDSTETRQGPRINECLYFGPNPYVEMVLLRFRMQPVARAADVEKADELTDGYSDAARFL